MARFTLPRDLYHGKGALEALKTFKGKKAIICVGGGSMKRFGFLQKAEDYLKEAGMENGFEVEFMYLANSTNNMLAELLQQMWSQIGVTLILKPTESGALTTSLNKGEQELCCAGTCLLYTSDAADE